MSAAAEKLDDWLNKEAVTEDDITAFPLTALAATLDREESGETVPPLWHWLYFLPVSPMAEVGADGHPKRGGFLPPVPLPRRMWAGGRLTFHAPLKVGERATRTSTHRQYRGQDRPLGPPRVRHGAARDRSERRAEARRRARHRLSRRAAGRRAAAAPQLAPEGETWRRTIDADAVMLFRYSALTFNGHRIHYDHPYVTQVEGYPGLIVHGPLIATLLVDLVRREQPDATLQSFAFRALRPTFAGQPFTVCGQPSADGKTIDLWAKDHEGYLTMRATAALA